MDRLSWLLGSLLALTSCASTAEMPACSETQPTCPNAAEAPRPEPSTVLGAAATTEPEPAQPAMVHSHMHMHGGHGG
ncbi:MAG: hypothetical protein K8S98_16120 [Planctomycetes bacterium]|nr:hypothetical protein [Planctomycetota bacterium]